MVENEEHEAGTSDEEQFARNLQAMRERKGWSQSELARRMVDAGWKNYNQMTISRTEKGDRPIRLNEARALAQIFGVPIDHMTYSEERLNVSLAQDRVAAAYRALAAATRVFLDAQNALAVKADSAVLSGEEIDTDGVEDWLQQAPEAVIEDAKFAAGEASRESDWQEMRDRGFDSMSQLEKYRLDEAVAAGFESYAAQQRSSLSHLKFVNLLERSRSGEHPEA
ncbi:helix-turn-helix transcriptional regulator [Paenarthrobacter nicotinovorans]|uniref:helix-turn-helix transcriptional regulator n=1 Tax=Paenarthrobacter nicotinovorans TaxID=29320 RepID=UPI003A81050D